MLDRNLTPPQSLGIVTGVVLVSALFINSSGTPDMKHWVEWTNNAERLGVVDGFKANNLDYPPLTTAILWGSFRAAQLFGMDLFTSIKLSVLFFLFLTSSVFWLWSRNLVLATLLHLSLLLNSVALAYLDVYFAPLLLIALMALKEKKLSLFAAAFSLSCFIKWQPLIIAPFLAIYVIACECTNDRNRIDLKRLCNSIIAPAVTVIVLIVMIFGAVPVLNAFQLAFTLNSQLSAHAANLNWVITHFLHVFDPGRFGSLWNGEADIIDYPPFSVTFVPRLLFLLMFAITLATFAKRKKSFENLLHFAILGYWTYFTLNTGVHENHLFLPMVLSVLLFWLHRSHWPLMTTILILGNFNLYIFYGIDGQGLGYSRVIGRVADAAVLLATFNVVAFAVFWAAHLTGRQDVAA